jgi:hypothetical protein
VLAVLGFLTFAAAGCGKSTEGPAPSASATPVRTTEPTDIGTSREAIVPSSGSFVALAERSIRLRQNARVISGDVGARATTTTGVLQPGQNVWFEQVVTTPGAIYGAWVGIDANVHAAAIFSDHFTHGPNATWGAVSAFVQPPALPAAPSVTAGAASFTLERSRELTRPRSPELTPRATSSPAA